MQALGPGFVMWWHRLRYSIKTHLTMHLSVVKIQRVSMPRSNSEWVPTIDETGLASASWCNLLSSECLHICVLENVNKPTTARGGIYVRFI